MHTSSEKEFALYAAVARKKYLSLLPKNKSARFLDVACGAGHFLYFLKKEGYENVHGIDLSPSQLTIARAMGVTEVEEANLFDYLRMRQHAYDIVIAHDIIEHLLKNEVLQFLDMIHAALAPGGSIIVSAPNASSLFGASLVYIDFTHEMGFTPTSLTHVLRTCGFHNIALYGDGPVAHDVRSFMRVFLWKCITMILRLYRTVESGTGRGLWIQKDLFEPRIIALGKKQ